MRHAGWWTIRALAMAFLLAGVGAWCQAAPEKESKPAANAWMLTPTPYLEWNKDVSESLRRERDLFWDGASMSRVPLTSPGHGVIPSGADFSAAQLKSDIRDATNRAILTAAFIAHRSVLSASEFSLYTEITLHVDQVFEDRTGSGHPFTGRDITVTVYGGTVLLPSGKPLSINTQPRKLFLQPDHKYLLVLSYHNEGDFYSHLDNWDISDGTVQPNSLRTRYVARSGRSALAGIPVQQIGPVLDRELQGDR